MNVRPVVDKGLRDYQQDVLRRLQEAWKSYRNVMVQMPTGTGKTHVLAEVVRGETGILRKDNGERERGSGGQNGAVWIVAHRRELVAQIEETLGKYGIDIGEGQVRVVSIQWLSRHWADCGESPRLIIIDEAHHALAETYRDLWKRVPEARKLGMTATPCRMNRKGFTELFDTLITSWSIADFISKGYLSVFDYVSIRQESEEQVLIDSLEKRGTDGDYQVKEMNDCLNRQASIERLYQSVCRFADRKKGIVYAISIDHARRVAEYYNNKGISAVAIDSKTPACDRKRWVEDFRNGAIQVLVNVDVFSEGFDCPDVEFVQMARPTLSLSKYLQQVGRGLRRTEGKETCILIDNVGLYRVFGLPVQTWDWYAMFCGTVTGKGRTVSLRAVSAGTKRERMEKDSAMETVMSHDRLLDHIEKERGGGASPVPKELGAYRDERNGLWGLCVRQKPVTEPIYVRVFELWNGMAAVRFQDFSCGVVSWLGKVLWRSRGVQRLEFAADSMLSVQMSSGQKRAVDLCNFRTYDCCPELKRYGGIVLLKVGGTYYSRTRRVYVSGNNINPGYICRRTFYLTILDGRDFQFGVSQDRLNSGMTRGYACLLDGDADDFYWVRRWLPDGSIIVEDSDGRFYHAAEGMDKRYIGSCCSREENEVLQSVIERMEAGAGTG